MRRVRKPKACWPPVPGTNSQTFPFVLTDGQQRRLFITARGDVYDKAGQRVAKLHDTM